jgi:hypothetical protein
MADEIVAKYKVDVDGATKALDTLIAKMSQTGKSLEDSFVKGSEGVKRLQTEIAKQPKTIAELELRLVRLKELLRDDTQVGTQGFKAVTAAIKETQFQIDKTSGKLGSVSAKVKQAIRESAAETEKARIKQEEYNKSLAKTPTLGDNILNKFKAVGAALLAAFAVDKIISFTKEAMTLAAKAEGVERAFAKIGSPELLAGLRSATNGTVTDLVLMQSAVKASNFKIPLDQLGSLLKYAQMQARATGQDVDYLVESLITGIGRKSVLVLDNLQISAVELREKLGDVSMETATVGQVAEAVGTIASASFAKMGAQALTTADEIAQMETAYSNFMLKVGAVGNSALIPFAKYIGLISQDAQAVADLQLKLSGASLGQTRQIVNELTAAYEKASDAAAEFGLSHSETKDKATKNLKVAKELLEVAKADFELKQKTRAGGFEEEPIKPSEVNAAVQADINKKLEEEAKLRASQIQNIFFVDKALADLNDELKAEGTSLERITAIMPLINALEEQRKTILGQETEAMKAKRIAEEKLLEIEKKRAEEYNKAQEAEAERLLKQEEDNAKERVKIAEDMAKMLIEIERYLATTSEEIRDVDLADNQRRYEKDLEDVMKAASEHVLQGEKLATQLQAITDAKNKADEESQEAHNQRIFELNKALADRNAALDDKKAVEKQKKLDDELNAIVTYTGVAIQAVGLIAQAQQQQNDYEFALLDERLERGLITQEEYDNKRRQLMQKQAEDAKTVAVFNAILGGIVAVVNAFSQGGPVLAAITAALVAVEIGLAIATPVPQFAKGVVDLQGEGTGTSDSISAKLSKGESVITAKETSKHKGLLEAMNKGLAEKYIMSNYVKPALDSAMLSGFADMGKSAEVNGLTANLKDHNIIAAMDRNRQATVQGLKIIAERMSNQKAAKRGGYA